MDASGFKELHQVVSTHCAKAREYPTGRECNCPIGDPANGGSILNWPVHQTCSEHQIVFMKEHGLNATNIGPYGGGYAGHCTMSPNPALYSDGSGSGRSAVDIWVLLPLMYNNSKSEVNRVLQKGDSVWSYNTLG